MNQLCTIGACYSAFENSDNRDSAEPSTEYTIFYIMGAELRLVKINAASPFKAFQTFKELFPDTYNHSAIKEIESPEEVKEVEEVKEEKKVLKVKPELSEYKKQFIIKHYHSKSNRAIASNLNVRVEKVEQWINELGLEKSVPVGKFFTHDKHLYTV